MHRRQLVLLYAILVVIAALLAWRISSEWKHANLRYGAAVSRKAGPTTTIPPSATERRVPQGDEIVARNLFSPDRNNTVAVDLKASGPPAPIPIVFGTMKLGAGYEALMAEGGKTGRPAFRRVKNGERMGDYEVVDISDDKVVVELQGQKTTISVYQSANSVPRIDARSSAAFPPAVEGGPMLRPAEPSAPTVTSSSPSSPSNATVPPASDGSVHATIEGNRRRMERQTPFGTQVWYENIQK